MWQPNDPSYDSFLDRELECHQAQYEVVEEEEAVKFCNDCIHYEQDEIEKDPCSKCKNFSFWEKTDISALAEEVMRRHDALVDSLEGVGE